MRIRRLTVIALSFSLLIWAQGLSQSAKGLSAEEANDYIEQSKQMVKYLEGTLNFLGDPTQVPSEKDIIINQSYLKVFQDEETQVEDDLDPRREMAMNKDVQAYLKDVDFFFKKVKFNFDITKVEQLVNENGQPYFKVTLNRNLNGITIDDDTLNNNLVRYIEINLDQVQKDLKIASMYTTKPDIRGELNYWWAHMSDGWKGFFGDSIFIYHTYSDTIVDSAMVVTDTIPLSKVLAFTDSTLVSDRWVEDYRIDSFMAYKQDTLPFPGLADSMFYLGDTIIDSIVHYLRVYDTIPTDGEFIYKNLEQLIRMKNLDISGNQNLTDLKPVSLLSDLAYINFSNTLIADLSQLRSLNKLETVHCAGSHVNTLEPLRYSSNLKEINCASTAITDIGVLAFLKQLYTLNISDNRIDDLSPLAELEGLNQLKLSGLSINDISSLEELENLTDLSLSRTSVTNITSVGKISNLQSLNIDSTYVTRLDALKDLGKLSTLQANSSRISVLDPLSGMASLTLIYCDNTGIDGDKSSKFMEENPHCLVIYNTKKLEQWWMGLPEVYKNIVRERRGISDPISTEQLHEIINLTTVDLSNNADITTIEPLSMLHRLEILNLENTPVEDLTPLSGLNNLRQINVSGTRVSSIMPLRSLQNLTQFSCEHTEVNELRSLVNNKYLGMVFCDGTRVDNEEVMGLKDSLPNCLVVYQTPELTAWWDDLDETWQKTFESQMSFKDDYGRENLQRLVDLGKVEISDNPSIRDLEPLSIFSRLGVLTVSNTAVRNLSPLARLTMLRELNVPNNPVEDLSTITGVHALRELNVENTAVSDLSSIGQMKGLTKLNIAGTPIKNLKGIENLSNLETLIINNTPVKKIKQLDGLTNLKELKCYRTEISSKTIDQYREKHRGVNIEYY
jgi:Leucine-rich repeat (LRR) protein